ncbi:141L [Cherax quadricarinatus iridovirus]|uniref:Uncharacterized protein n=1 Tax=Shrimp hemocyte iridescent virus TaxID=2039780 RepID=A0A291B0K6_9VIRU|nr:141L [Cherax quadricarinatus iridovirus]YP_010084767.1 hypothetical protein KM509_gp015 [Shrimp hemocyte iridescent virus]UPA43288.1 hypothetical protein 4TH000014 [Iridovirus CN01]ASZ85121.1 141L [Cherax quadricarinatus iridovirus]ATE87024.1 hypothetical protein [Shrimp hemocyte iridescent virus]UPA43523.1 hypothetical protein 3TG000090 [Iridovirus CN01]UPA43720.1 hypothetical protein 1DG000128 [Iridovirus CN01]
MPNSFAMRSTLKSKCNCGKVYRELSSKIDEKFAQVTQSTPTTAPVAAAVTTPKPKIHERRVVQVFTPRNVTKPVSLVNEINSEAVPLTTLDKKLVTIPANAIIDRIEYFGTNNFATKGNFSIGLGQFNGNIMVPLIENGTSAIANEKVGGCRDFISSSSDGKNNKSVALFESFVNITTDSPITSGFLQVVIEYHVKNTTF